MIKGCTDSGQSKKNCTCSVEKLGETYNMKVLDEDLDEPPRVSRRPVGLS